MRWTVLLVVLAITVGCGKKVETAADTHVAPAGEPVAKGASEKAPPKVEPKATAPEMKGAVPALTADQVRAARKLLGQGGDVKVEGFSSFKSAQDFDLPSISRLVAEDDGLQKAAKALADHDPATHLFVLANARRPVNELIGILGPAEKTTRAEESFRIPEATEVGFQHKVTVTWHEYNWLAFASVEGKIVAARVSPKKFVESQKAAGTDRRLRVR